MIKKLLIGKLGRKSKKEATGPVSFREVRTIGILAEWGAQTVQVRELTEWLEREQKVVKLLFFVAKPDKKETYPQNTFSRKNITLMGTIRSEEVSYFCHQHFDYVLCLDPTGNQFMGYVLAKVNAKHKIGYYHENFSNHLDMMLKPNPAEKAHHDLFRYLKMIRHD
jgi:hypothetical protein